MDGTKGNDKMAISSLPVIRRFGAKQRRANGRKWVSLEYYFQSAWLPGVLSVEDHEHAKTRRASRQLSPSAWFSRHMPLPVTDSCWVSAALGCRIQVTPPDQAYSNQIRKAVREIRAYHLVLPGDPWHATPGHPTTSPQLFRTWDASISVPRPTPATKGNNITSVLHVLDLNNE